MVALGLWAFWLEPASLIVSEERFSLPLSTHRPLRVAILTDLHVGSPFNGIVRLRDVVSRTNAARPDIVCILGDVVMIKGVIGGRQVPPEEIAAELKHLSAPAGVVAVLGNHDGWFDHDRVRAALEASGIRVIEEATTRIETPAGPLWFAGISDLWTGRHDIAAALSSVQDDGASVVLLTHNPDVFPFVPRRVALTLAAYLLRAGSDCRLSAVRLCYPTRAKASPPATWLKGAVTCSGNGHRRHPAGAARRRP
jgi:predicted MPP superfamily phosphohydrolase